MEFSQFSLIHAKHFLILQKIRTAKLSKEILIWIMLELLPRLSISILTQIHILLLVKTSTQETLN
jgi:hypothetical protein